MKSIVHEITSRAISLGTVPQKNQGKICAGCVRVCTRRIKFEPHPENCIGREHYCFRLRMPECLTTTHTLIGSTISVVGTAQLTAQPSLEGKLALPPLTMLSHERARLPLTRVHVPSTLESLSVPPRNNQLLFSHTVSWDPLPPHGYL